MLNNFGDIRNDVIVQLGVSTTVAFYTESILNTWVQKAHDWAAGYKKWTVTEGRVTTTWVSGTEEYPFPEGWKPDSIRLLQVGGKRFRKLNFYKYQEWREDYPTSTTRLFSDYGKVYFINPNTDVSGTITVWGQYTPTDIDVTDLTAKTVFSDSNDEANEAIVHEVISYARIKEKKSKEADYHHQRAIQILLEKLQQVQEEQFSYQDGDNDGMFKRIDIVHGDFYSDLVKRDQFF